MDYYSKFIEVDKLENLSSAATIDALKSQMSRHGIAEKLRSDNGTQFASREFALFCKDYQIDHYTSSPAFPQSNGAAERAVQIVKRLWRKCTDKHLALLDYRTTPLENCHLSPAQLCMSRRPRNKLPIARELLRPTAYDVTKVRRSLDQEKERQRHYHDTHVKDDLPVLLPGDPVRMAPFPGSKKWQHATVVSRHQSPRSYVIEHNGRKLYDVRCIVNFLISDILWVTLFERVVSLIFPSYSNILYTALKLR